MIKELKYSGFSTVPSDYECPDGSLAMSLNLIPEDGALHPLPKPKVVLTLPSSDYFVTFIHKNTGYTHYIIASRNNPLSLWWMDGSSAETILNPINGLEETPAQIQAIGNILIVSTTSSIFYLAWSPQTGDYIFLGNSLPLPVIGFALQARLKTKEYDCGDNINAKEVDTSDDDIDIEDTYTPYESENLLIDKEFPVGTLTDVFPYITTWITCDDDISFNPSFRYRVDITFSGIENPDDYSQGNEYSTVYLKSSESAVYYKYNTQIIEYRHFQHIEFTFHPYVSFSGFRIHLLKKHLDKNVKAHVRISVVGAYSSVDKAEFIHVNTSAEAVQAAFAAINPFVKEKATSKGLFIHPFFIRYALRLYDGSYAKLSAPVLLNVSSGYSPAVRFDSKQKKLQLGALICALQYRIFSGNIKEEWKDFIAGVDVFITPPLYPYHQDPQVKEGQDLIHNYADPSVSFALYENKDTEKYLPYDIYKVLASEKNWSAQTEAPFIRIAPKNSGELSEDFLASCNFYKIHEFDFNDIFDGGAYANLDFSDKVNLDSLTTLPRLEDNILSFESLKGDILSYNNRLHVFNTSFSQRIVQSPFAQNTFNSGLISRVDPEDFHVRYLVKIRANSASDVVVELPMNYSSEIYQSIFNGFDWFFFPDSRAYELWIVYGPDEVGDAHIIPLTEHPFLNGSYFLYATMSDKISFKTQIPFPDVNPYYPSQSVYVSLANNPFVFEAASALSIPGVSHIMALASAARPLSQGQFGQFPLYAFTDEGVWALEVSSTGTYSARQPITRDVCVNPRSICPIDSAVLFTTHRGIMIISGSNTTCITDVINSEMPFNVGMLPSMDKLHAMMKHQEDSCFPLQPFSKFLSECGMIYDYVHQHIIVYNPAVSYAYVYSLKSQQWGMICSDICSHLNSYPNALAMSSGGQLVDFTAPCDPALSVDGLLVSRPFKLDAPDTFKTIDTIIQRGHFRKGHVRTVLYGSRDLFSWHIVWSSNDHYLRGFRGTPYKYFRLALICNLSPDESIHGATVKYTPRLMNQPR